MSAFGLEVAIPLIIAAAMEGVKAAGTGIEANRPENRLTELGWLQRAGLDEARGESERRALGRTGAMRRGAQLVDMGPKAGYLVGDVGAGAAAGSMLPAFRQLMAEESLREKQKLGALTGQSLEERGGLQAASAGRLSALGGIATGISKLAGGIAEKGLEGTDFEDVPLSEVLSGVSGVTSMAGQAGLGRQRRRGERKFSDTPLFGGSEYGLYGGGY